MTVLDVVRSAATRMDLEIPSALFVTQDRTWVEVADQVNTCARQILEEYDWERLKKIAVINGDGVTEDFNLPSDYDRMTRDARLWDQTSPWWNVGQVTSEAWLALEEDSNLSWRALWTIFGGQMHIRSAPQAGQNIKYFYITNALVNGANSTAFTADSDSFVLDERLLKLSLIWNWRKNKGYDYASDLQEYQEALSYAIGKDKGPRRIYEGSNRGGYIPDVFAAVWGR